MIVTTFVDEEEQEVRVSVTDFGIGIPDFKQEAVFNKFYRVEESSLQFSGNGDRSLYLFRNYKAAPRKYRGFQQSR